VVDEQLDGDYGSLPQPASDLQEGLVPLEPTNLLHHYHGQRQVLDHSEQAKLADQPNLGEYSEMLGQAMDFREA
ncbi:unnamed protein product, partial [Allacma fusca]